MPILIWEGGEYVVPWKRPRPCSIDSDSLENKRTSSHAGHTVGPERNDREVLAWMDSFLAGARCGGDGLSRATRQMAGLI